MNQRVVLVLLVALSLVLAGCLGGGETANGGNGEDSSDGGASDGDASDGSSDDSDGASGDSGGESGADDADSDSDMADDDDGADADDSDGGVIVVDDGLTGDIDANAVAQRHEATLLAAGSFTTVYTVEGGVENAAGEELGTFSSEQTLAVDVGANTASQRIDSTTFGASTVRETYFDGTDTFVREGGIGPVTSQVPGYPATWEGDDVGSLTGVTAVSNDLQDARFTEVGQESYQGTTVVRYEFEGSENLAGGGLDPGLEVRSVSGVVLVDTDGVVRLYELSMTLEDTQSGNVFVIESVSEVVDVGSTTVAEPDWVSGARTA